MDHPVIEKVLWAYLQTGKLGREQANIGVNAEEALLIYRAVKEYVRKDS